MQDINMALGKTVRTMRLARKWTLKELSKRSGVPVGTIGALEMRDSVRSEYAAQLAHGFGVSLETLLPATDFCETHRSYEPNNPVAKSNQTTSAIDIAESLHNLRTAALHLDDADRAAVAGYVSRMIIDPDRANLVPRTLNILSPPHKGLPETGAQRAA